MNLWGPDQYAWSSVSLRGPQYGTTLSSRLFAWFFQFWHGPPSLTFLFIHFFNLGPIPKNSGPNQMSFQFLQELPGAPRKFGPLREEILDTPLNTVSLVLISTLCYFKTNYLHGLQSYYRF